MFSTCIGTGSAAAACTVDSGGNVQCSGSVTTPITVYDAAAAFQPTNGSNGYTPNNPAFPASGYNPAPPTVTVTFDKTASFNWTTNTNNLADRGMIAANFSDKEDPAVNNVVVNNAGWLSLTTSQISASRLHVIVADSQVNSFTVNNTGTIGVTQNFFGASFDLTRLSSLFSASAQTYSARYNGAALNIMSALYSDDNTNSFVLNNRAGGTVAVTGNFAAAYYGRADTTVTNSGTIANTSWTAVSRFYDGHWAIAAFAGAEFDTVPGSNPDSPLYNVVGGNVAVADTAALTLTNKAGGVIKGDILALDSNPLVVATSMASSGQSFGQQPVLTSSGSNSGPRDSAISNAGLIQGNLYLGSGEHQIENSGTITGGINVDQRASTGAFTVGIPGTVTGTFRSSGTGTDANGQACPTAGANTADPLCAATQTVVASFAGARSFTLSNSGTLGGDIVINDQSGSVNTILLQGTGFAGNVIAQNGTGSNSLTLQGVTNLASVQNFSMVDLTTSRVTTSGGISLVDGGTLATTIFGRGGTTASPSTNLGSINGTLTFSGAGSIAPTLAGIVRNGDVYQVASAVSAAGPVDVDFSSALVSFGADTSSGSLLLKASVMSPAAVPGLSAAGTAALTNLMAYQGSNAALQSLGGAVESLGSLGDVRSAGEQLRPFVNGAAIQVPLAITSLFQTQVDNRLGAAGAGSSPNARVSSAFAAASDQLTSMLLAYGAATRSMARKAPALIGAEPDHGMWGSLVGSTIRQHDGGGVAGYSGDAAGMIAGYDQSFSNAFRVGAAFGYATSTMDDRLAAGDQTGMQLYQGMVYGSYAMPSWYLSGSLGTAMIDYKTVRQISFPGFKDTASGSHNGWLAIGHLEAGMPVRLQQAVVTPLAALTYARIDQQAYNETSSAGAALAIAKQTTDSIRSELGMKATAPLWLTSTYGLGVETRALWRHEFGDTAQAVTAGFVGGSGTFLAVGPSPERNMAELGAALKVVAFGERQSLSLGYNAVVGSKYLEQNAALKVRAEF